MDDLFLSDEDYDMHLVREIRKLPELYDRRQPGYRNPKLREKLWADVAVKLNMRVKDCQMKWKNLRDKYVREQKRQFISQSQKFLKPYRSRWRMMDEFHFLDRFVRHKDISLVQSAEDGDRSDWDEDPSSSVSNSEENINFNPEPQRDFNEGSSPERCLISEPPDESHQNRDLTYPRRPLPGPLFNPTQLERKLIRIIASNVAEHADEDKLFCLSLVGVLKRLPGDVKALTKTKIQQLLFEAEFGPSEPENSSESQQIQIICKSEPEPFNYG